MLYKAGFASPSWAFNCSAVDCGVAKSYVIYQYNVPFRIFNPSSRNSHLRTQLSRSHLLLHVHDLLLLCERKSPRHTEHQCGCGEDEQRLAGEGGAAADVGCGGGDDVADGCASGGWDDVAQGEEAVGDGLVEGWDEVLVVGGDLGV